MTPQLRLTSPKPCRLCKWHFAEPCAKERSCSVYLFFPCIQINLPAEHVNRAPCEGLLRSTEPMRLTKVLAQRTDAEVHTNRLASKPRHAFGDVSIPAPT